jgi:RNA polymerase sigma-70 factor (ECF subfamily)
MDEAPETRREEFEREALPHLDALYGLALRLTGGDVARSEDLVQEAFLKAWRSWDRFEVGTNCRAWLLTILRNTFLNEARRPGSRGDAVACDDIAECPTQPALYEADPEGRALDRMLGAEIARAIEELPEVFRVPLVLGDVEGLGYQEIAEDLGIPVGTVKSRIFRGRRRLQESLYRHAVELGYVK